MTLGVPLTFAARLLRLLAAGLLLSLRVLGLGHRHRSRTPALTSNYRRLRHPTPASASQYGPTGTFSTGQHAIIMTPATPCCEPMWDYYAVTASYVARIRVAAPQSPRKSPAGLSTAPGEAAGR